MAYLNAHTHTAPTLTARLRSGIAGLATRYKQHRAYRETLEGLSALTNRELSDLGLNRSELRYVAKQAATRI